jgi:hypothetical protein
MPFLTAMRFRLFFLGDNRFDKGSTLEYRTFLAVLDVSLKVEPHPRVNLVVVYRAHSSDLPNAIGIKCYNFEGPMNSSGNFCS